MTLELIKPAMELAECNTLSEFLEWLKPEPPSTMPFGKHKGAKLCNLPKDYVSWALKNMDALNPDLRAALEAQL
ncbi:hypothetical protein D9M71_831560 [compost metagenome]